MLLKRRHDLIPNLVDAAKTCIDQDTEALEAVTTARNAAQSALTVARGRPVNALAVTSLAAAEQTLAASLASLFALSDSNPKLQADRSVQGLREELVSIENKVAFARQTFNDAVLDYNSAQGQFPAVMLAKLFSFAPSAMLQAIESAGARAAA